MGTYKRLNTNLKKVRLLTVEVTTRLFLKMKPRVCVFKQLGAFQQRNRISEENSCIRAHHASPGELLGGRYLRLCHIICGRLLMKATADALGATYGDTSMENMQRSVSKQSDVPLNTAAALLKLKIQDQKQTFNTS